MNPKNYYETYWKIGGYTSRVYTYFECKKAYIKNIKVSNKKILDIGCGDGEFSSMLLNNNNKVFGLDISETAVRAAQERGIQAEYFDVNENLSFEDESFDIVLIFDTLEHVFDPCFILKESYRVLKPDGILYCGIPNASMLVNRLRFLFTGNFKDCTAIGDKIIPDLFFSDHIRFFSPKIIKSLLLQYDFCIENIDYWFPGRFENSFYNKFSWIAKAIVTFKLEKLFPDLISSNMFIKASKRLK